MTQHSTGCSLLVECIFIPLYRSVSGRCQQENDRQHRGKLLLMFDSAEQRSYVRGGWNESCKYSTKMSSCQLHMSQNKQDSMTPYGFFCRLWKVTSLSCPTMSTLRDADSAAVIQNHYFVFGRSRVQMATRRTVVLHKHLMLFVPCVVYNKFTALNQQHAQRSSLDIYIMLQH